MIVYHIYDNTYTVEVIVGYDYVPYHNALKWIYYNRFGFNNCIN